MVDHSEASTLPRRLAVRVGQIAGLDGGHGLAATTDFVELQDALGLHGNLLLQLARGNAPHNDKIGTPTSQSQLLFRINGIRRADGPVTPCCHALFFRCAGRGRSNGAAPV